MRNIYIERMIEEATRDERKHKLWIRIITAVEIAWLILLICIAVALFDVVTSMAATPYIDGATGEWVMAEISTQDNAIDINEAPPINNISKALEALEDNPYLSITFTDEEAQELRWVLALAAQGEGFEGEICCCEVIFNRILSRRDWGQENGIHGVLSMKGQFTEYRYINSPKAWAVPGQMEDDAISECMRRGPSSLPDIHYVYFDTGRKNGSRNIKIGHHWFGAEK
jgi:hypothetical protein